MITMTRTKAAIGGVLIGVALLAHSGGSLLAQDYTPTPGGSSSMSGMGMMSGTPTMGSAQMANEDDMQQMMAQCMRMMQMMMGMMGSNGSGMMSGQGMQGMSAATPTHTP